MSLEKKSFDTIRADLSLRTAAIAFFGSISSAGFGFDQGWWSGAISFAEFSSVFGSYDEDTDTWSLSATQQSVGTGLGIFAVVVGLLLGSPLTEHFGRWKTFLIQSLLLIVGIAIEATAVSSYTQLTVGRFIVYIGGGVATNVVPVYMAECAPPSLRGLLATTYNGAQMLGAFFGALILYLCQDGGSHWSWRGVVVAQVGTPLICLVGLTVLPESPRWLVSRGRHADAIVALGRLRGANMNAEAEVGILDRQFQEEKKNTKSYMTCFQGTNLRRTSITVGAQILQQALGIAFIGNYLGVFLLLIGFNNSLLIIMLTYVIGIAASFVTMFTIDVTGRRKMLFYPAIMLAIIMFIVASLTRNGSVGLSESARTASVALLLIWFAIFQVTWGPGARILTAEIPGSAVREKSVTISAVSAYAVNCIITFLNPFVMAAINGKVGFIFGAFALVAATFVFFFLPEVSQRSLAEIDELFAKRVPTRKFPEHVCESRVSVEHVASKYTIAEENI